METNISDLILVIIILVIISIIIGIIGVIGYRRHIDKSKSNTIKPDQLKLGNYEYSDEENFDEDLSLLSNKYDYTYFGSGSRADVIPDVSNCIDNFNKTGLIDNILNKTLEPILYVRDIKERLPYAPSCSYYTTQHLGQLKLLIGEIHFCTIANKSKDDPFTFVYAGSSPNHKGFILNKMFPNMLAILIDPAEHLLYRPNNENHYNGKNNKVLYFCCSNTNRFNLKRRIINIFDGTKIQKLDRDSIEVKTISDKWRSSTVIDDSYLDVIKQITASIYSYNNIIIEDFFKDDTAEFCKKIPNIIFASDIRTNSHDILKLNTFGKKDVTDLDICVNSAMMLSWINIMNPRLSMLKFRPPYYKYTERAIFNNYYNTGMYKYYFDKVKHQVDFVSDYRKREFRYIIGEEIIQAYAGTTSGETRLIFGEVKFGLYDHLKREDNLFYYNQIRRQYGFHNVHIDKIAGIDNCGDCALAQKIIENYNIKYMLNTTTLQSMIILLRRSLDNGNHGRFYSINQLIYDVYRKQGSVLLSNYFKQYILGKMHPKSIDLNVEKRYKLKHIKLGERILEIAKRYIIDKRHGDVMGFKFVLLRYLLSVSTWSNRIIMRNFSNYELVTLRALDEESANKLLDELDVILHEITYADYSDKADIIIKHEESKIIMSYKDYTITISDKWYYAKYLLNSINLDAYLNAIMYDSRISHDGFISMPDIITEIIESCKYDNIYEISLGLHDQLFITPPTNMNLLHFTHLASGVHNLEDLNKSTILPKTIIFGFYASNPLCFNWIYDIMPSDTILILYTLDSSVTRPKNIGYQIRIPYSSVSIMKEPVTSKYTLFTSFHFQGPPNLIYHIQDQHEKLI